MTLRDITRPFRRLGRRIRREFTSKYGKSKFALVIAGLILVTVSGILATGVLQQRGRDSYQRITDAGQTSTKVSTTAENPAVAEEQTSTAVQQKTGSSQEIAAGTVTDTANTSDQTGGSNNAGEQQEPSKEEQTTENTVTKSSQAVGAAADQTGGWLEQRITKYQDQIDPKDLQDFKAITAKLDQGYIQSLYSGGLNEEERGELRDYLNSTLSGGEYNRAKELFATYIYLLKED